jgi:hypothetical protein
MKPAKSTSLFEIVFAALRKVTVRRHHRTSSVPEHQLRVPITRATSGMFFLEQLRSRRFSK